MQSVYLDNAATTRLAPEVRAAMTPFEADAFGNPSSRHALGVHAEEALDRARAQLRRALAGPRRRIVLTSGGTEANNLAVLGAARARKSRGRHVLIGPFEHASVREAAAALAREGFEVESIPAEAGGELDPERAADLLRPDTVLVACMLVSNEFGTILPIEAIARRLRTRAPQAFLHVDAVQALGKLELSIEDLDADSLTVSAHKVHGPKGVGALVLREGLALEPILFGGGQEGGLRPGTENVAGAVGLGLAVERAEQTRGTTVEVASAARAELVRAIGTIPAARALTSQRVVPTILSVVVPGPPAEVWLHHLEERGIQAGAGSACQAKKQTLSPSFAARGLTEDQARRVLRFSFSASSDLDQARRAAASLTAVAEALVPGAGVKP